MRMDWLMIYCIYIFDAREKMNKIVIAHNNMVLWQRRFTIPFYAFSRSSFHLTSTEHTMLCHVHHDRTQCTMCPQNVNVSFIRVNCDSMNVTMPSLMLMMIMLAMVMLCLYCVVHKSRYYTFFLNFRKNRRCVRTMERRSERKREGGEWTRASTTTKKLNEWTRNGMKNSFDFYRRQQFFFGFRCSRFCFVSVLSLRSPSPSLPK